MQQRRVERRLARVYGEMQRRVSVVVERIDDVRLAEILIQSPF